MHNRTHCQECWRGVEDLWVHRAIPPKGGVRGKGVFIAACRETSSLATRAPSFARWQSGCLVAVPHSIPAWISIPQSELPYFLGRHSLRCPRARGGLTRRVCAKRVFSAARPSDLVPAHNHSCPNPTAGFRTPAASGSAASGTSCC
jgi:hypothetical protein